jgi:hypothetical protein
VVGAFDLGNLGTSGESPGRLQTAHHCLGAGVGEADLLKPGIPAAKVFGKLHFGLGGQHER